MSAAPFEPGRFDSTVPYYIAFRPRYPIELLRRALTELQFGPGARVLDLGCGPGFLANGFAELGCDAVGIDPSLPMLEAARIEAARCGVTVGYRLGSSYDLDTLDGPFDLVAMGRAFHWMDRARTLQSLERLVAPAGAVALFYDSHIRSAENAAITVADKVREKFGRAHTIRPKHKPLPVTPDESVFMDSRFSRIVRIGLVERRPINVDALIGRSLSTSFTSPESLGDRRPAFETAMRARLAELRPDGKHTELIEFTALICRRAS